MVDRYDMKVSVLRDVQVIYDKNGKWVKWEDVAALIAQPAPEPASNSAVDVICPYYKRIEMFADNAAIMHIDTCKCQGKQHQ